MGTQIAQDLVRQCVDLISQQVHMSPLMPQGCMRNERARPMPTQILGSMLCFSSRFQPSVRAGWVRATRPGQPLGG